MKFFIPHLQTDPAAAEVEWNRYVRESTGGSAESRRIYSLTYEHEGDKYVVVVGKPRSLYARKTGPRGGYIKNAGQVGWGQDTGTMVSGMVEVGGLIYVWSYGPPFGGWANPSLVGRGEIQAIEYFDAPDKPDGDG